MYIPLTQGKRARVDERDAPLLFRHKWSAVRIRTRGVGRSKWYAVTHHEGATRYMHRLLMGEPRRKQVDHVNGNGLDNRRVNLRLATKSEQQRNSVKKGRRRSSRFKGVFRQTWPLIGGGVGVCWRVQIELPGRRRINLRTRTEREAARLYNQLARRHFGPFARLNAGV